jgi:hypothetical protein
MWIGRFLDEYAPKGVRETAPCGDHDTAMYRARIQRDMLVAQRTWMSPAPRNQER